MHVLTIVGTRPEAVKMAPVLRALHEQAGVRSTLLNTGQHPELVDEPLRFFGLSSDHDLRLMRAGEHPEALVSRATAALEPHLKLLAPDRVLVQGDTASALAGARAAQQANIPVGHVEAGLRTYGHLPWPEEAFRCEIDRIADLLFAPTPLAALNLRNEGVVGTAYVTGNSGVDACRLVSERLARDVGLQEACDALLPIPKTDRPLIVATLHRRESFAAAGELCAALLQLAHEGLAEVIVPVHPNGALAPHLASLHTRRAIELIAPLPYPAMIRLMHRADLILTDSGGIQEEAPSFGKRVLVLRDATERPEAIADGLAELVGLDRNRILAAARPLLQQPAPFPAAFPYGDGHAAGRIVSALLGDDNRSLLKMNVPMLG